jgi:hypothetical protein
MKKFLILIVGAAIGALLYQWLVHSKAQPSTGDPDNFLP